MDMDRRNSGLTKLGFGVLACNSAIAVFRSWGDAGAVAFVLAADAALVLLFACLREFDRRRGRDDDGAAAWAITTLLTGGQYAEAELLKMGFAVAACDSALAHHHAGGDDDAGSLVLVFLAYVGFVTLAWLFLRRFHGRARAGQ